MSRLYDTMYKSSSMTAKALSLVPSFFTFNEWYRFLKKSQWLSREKLEEYQLKRLQSLLHHSYENVPYYRRVFDERGLKPDDIQELTDLHKLPFLTKDLIRKNLKYLKADNYPDEKFEYVTTSGTTAGAMGPLGFYYEKRKSRAIEWAFMKSQWDRVGYKFWDRCVILRGYGTRKDDTDRFYEHSFFNRWLLLSPFHMNDENIRKYIEVITDFKPKFIQAFPSEIMLLAKYMKNHNFSPFSHLKALLLGSENLYPFQRRFLEDFFQCRVYSWYGHAEQAVLAGECEKSTSYHVFPEYGIIELVNQNGEIITDDNVIGEIVATGLNNFIMPMIRYKTKDLGKLSKSTCKCGRKYPLITELDGRIQEMILANGGNLISLTAVLAAIKRLEGYPQLEKVQFIQEKKGEVLIKIVKGKSYSKADEKEIMDGVEQKFGKDLKIMIVYVDDIQPTSLGKHRFLIQKLPIQYEEING